MTQPAQPSPTWWSSNWKWVVPVGCLVPVLLVALIFWIVFTALKSTTPYREALERARTDCGIQQLLGTPVEAGWTVMGSASVSGGSGQADLSFPIKGPRAEGTLYLTATRSAGQWQFNMLKAAVPGRTERIDLLDKGRDRCP